MGEELREALEKHLFNYTWGRPDGAGSKVFPVLRGQPIGRASQHSIKFNDIIDGYKEIHKRRL